jgi:prepilin-type N-terminal cleavage/methylation domain-containing protein
VGKSHVTSHQNKSGFTIVELLIVIVVIAVLAAISIVAYTGVQQKTRTSAVSSALSQANKKLATYMVENNSYPPDLTTININDTSSMSYQYSVNNSANPATYCITATNGNISYKASSASTTPTSGGCAGHGTGGVAAVTNLSTNPSFETNLGGGYSSYNSAPLATLTTGCYLGSRCASVDTSAGANRGIIYQLPTAQAAGSSFVYSAYIKGTPGQVVVISARPTDGAGTYLGEGAGGFTHTLTSTWTRIATQPVALPANATRPGFQIRANTGDPSPFQVDAVMITQGNSLYNYADGNSLNWVWNGGSENSASTGPAP